MGQGLTPCATLQDFPQGSCHAEHRASMTCEEVTGRNQKSALTPSKTKPQEQQQSMESDPAPSNNRKSLLWSVGCTQLLN